MKRSVRPFTVEVRQTKKRLKPAEANPSWIDAMLVTTEPVQKSRSLAPPAFKTAAADMPSEVAAPAIPSRRILPSLLEADRATATADAQSENLERRGDADKRKDPKPRSYGATASAVRRRPRTEGERPTLPPAAAPAEPLRVAENVEPRLDIPASASEQSAAPRASARKVRAARPKTPRFVPPTDAVVRLATAVRSDGAANVEKPDAPAHRDPSTDNRKNRVLSRYVFRDEQRPGENWKQRLRARRERRV